MAVISICGSQTVSTFQITLRTMTNKGSPIGSLNLGLLTLPTTTADYFTDNSLELQGAKDAEAPRAAHYQHLYQLGYHKGFTTAASTRSHTCTALHSLTESHQIHNNSEHLKTHLTHTVLYSRPPGDSVLSPLLPLMGRLLHWEIQSSNRFLTCGSDDISSENGPFFHNVSEKTQEQENYIIQPERVS